MSKEFYTEWEKYIRDDVRLTQVVMPGAHNAGSYGMNLLARCQEHGVYEQYIHGVRHFCVRIDTHKGEIFLDHGPIRGFPFTDLLKDFKRVIEEFDDFFIINLREYQPQVLLFKQRTYFADKDKVDELLEEYIRPSEYAFTDFDKISDVTMEDIRKSGKKYLLLNYRGEYKYSRDCVELLPFDKDIHGSRLDRFLKRTLKLLDEADPDGLYTYQTQRTAGFGTEVGGIRYPKTLDREMGDKFHELLDTIKSNEEYLKKLNIIGADFLTYDYKKCRAIIELNLLKENVRPECIQEFASGLGD